MRATLLRRITVARYKLVVPIGDHISHVLCEAFEGLLFRMLLSIDIDLAVGRFGCISLLNRKRFQDKNLTIEFVYNGIVMTIVLLSDKKHGELILPQELGQAR